jgi:predicted NBD/HSP70 family sugar kinase
LIKAKVLLEVPNCEPTPTGGRPLEPLDVDASLEHFVGIKLTGEAAFAVLTDLRTQPLRTATTEIHSHEPASVLKQMADLVADLAQDLAVRAVGLGLGGAVDNYTAIRSAYFLDWHDVDLKAIAKPLLEMPVVATNDIESLLEAENWFGAGREIGSFAVITTGSGVGGGLVLNNRLVTSPDAGLGLIGHQPIDPTGGPQCERSHRGCASAYLRCESISNQTSQRLGRPVTYDQALDLAAAGDPEARAVVDQAGYAYGMLIAAVANIALPQRVILTGEGWRLAQVAAPALAEGLRYARNPLAAEVPLQILPDDPLIWARGAAAVAIQQSINELGLAD